MCQSCHKNCFKRLNFNWIILKHISGIWASDQIELPDFYG